jgi:hypothetical protein
MRAFILRSRWLQPFRRYPSHQAILNAQQPPVYVHRSGTRCRRSESPRSPPCLCRRDACGDPSRGSGSA